MNAKKKNAQHLPHFVDFERWGMRSCVMLDVHPTRLRDFIGKRPEMERHGQKIIRNLLLGMLELRKHNLVLRDINPQ